VDNSLTFALLWLERARHASHRGTIASLRVILPKNTGGVVAHRLKALDPGLAVELFELDPILNVLEKLDARGSEHGILDLLTVTRSGRLAIIELKASEHIHLPLQAADYWLRVRKHLENVDIARYGYFPGIELQQVPPFVYLVAPALRFHPSTDNLLKYLSPELEVVCVGLAESWRRGLRVVMRK
jgi:hypothetical protein